VVKIELLTINNRPYFGEVSDDEQLYIWMSVLGRKKEEISGAFATKSLSRLVRITYRLVTPIKLREIYCTETFKYDKILDDDAFETITGRLLGYNCVKHVELGQRALITVKTNFGVEPEGVTNWLKLYGNVISQRYLKNKETDLDTDVIEAEVVLKEHIPEYLPMYGQKCQVSYAGIPKLCNNCFMFNHYRKECKNKKMDCVEYIIQLIMDQKISHELVGTWKNAMKRWEDANSDAALLDDEDL